MTNTIKFTESGRTKGTGKRRRAKLIAADVWGTSGYYPSTVLDRDAEAVFVPGTKMYENHFTESEEYARPEGDVAKLVGKLTSYGIFEPDNVDGPGVYADVEFYDSYVPRINEIGEDIGLSIRGAGTTEEGEVAGRYGPIVTQMLTINSVDVVTNEGAGGKLISILESAGPKAGTPINKEGDQSMTALTEEKFSAGITELKEALSSTFNEDLIASITEAIKGVLPAVAAVEEVAQVEGAAEVAAAAETAPAVVAEVAAPVAVEVNHSELATKFAESGLPTAVMDNVITAIKEGKSTEDAIASQVKLREAFAQATPTTYARITEAAGSGNASVGSQILDIFNKK